MSSREAPEPSPPRRREDGSDRSSSSSSLMDPTTTENRLLDYLSNVKSKFVAEKEAASLAATTSTTSAAAAAAAAAAASLHAGGDRGKLLHRPVHFVIGNEAGDADSVVSAIAHAYLLHSTGASADDTSSDPEQQRAGGVVVVVPVVSIPIRDVQTQRPETLFLLQTLAGITKLDELLCDIDELVEFVSVHAGRRHPITLVDHNQISSRLQQPPYATTDPTILEVVGIVDHHRDMGFHAETCSEAPLARNIAFDESTGHSLVASTCTLVVEELVRIRTGGGPPLELPPQVSVLLLGTILLDSINLDPRAGKVTDRDTAAVRELLRGTRWDGLGPEAKHALGMSGSNVQPDCSTLFHLLQTAKFDPEFWGSLSVRDALRLDYKQFSTGDAASNSNTAAWGMSTVLQDFDSFCNKADWERTISAYMIERNLDLLVVMLSTSSVGGGDATTDDRPATMKRELVLCDLRKGSIVNDLVGHLTGTPAPLELRLVEMLNETQALSSDTSSTVYVRAFHQGNAKASRKQVAPILFDYFEATNTSQST
jgi:exopolyphosphatase